MQLLKSLWNDTAGFVLSAEAVMIGTLGILGATVGLKAAGSAVNEEFTEMGQAFRRLDQSYAVAGQSCCGAWTAGSCFIQQSAETSVQDLCAGVEPDPWPLQEDLYRPPVLPFPPVPPAIPPLPEPPAAEPPAQDIPPVVN